MKGLIALNILLHITAPECDGITFCYSDLGNKHSFCYLSSMNEKGVK
jgi:hypothetical protein